MNGGSQRKGIGDHLVSCRCVDRVGELFELTREECQFAYRQSTIQANQWLVLDATFRLEFGNAVEIRREMLKILQERRKKFPLKEPNCGSVFVSDPAMYAQWGPPGAVIERCGLKGRRQGGAEISQRHANFIVNRNGGTAEDILFLIRLIRETAMEQLGCQLNCEVRYVAEDGSVEPAHEVFTSSTMPIITASEKVNADE
jgi:UDP-N-acetylmuramate dehydrogenase